MLIHYDKFVHEIIISNNLERVFGSLPIELIIKIFKYKWKFERKIIQEALYKIVKPNIYFYSFGFDPSQPNGN